MTQKPNMGCLPNHLPNRDQPIKIGDHERSTVFLLIHGKRYSDRNNSYFLVERGGGGLG